MYESFIAAMQERGRERQIVSKLLDLLPIPNMLLLAKLMTFLKKITKYSSTNKMTAKKSFNLFWT